MEKVEALLFKQEKSLKLHINMKNYLLLIVAFFIACGFSRKTQKKDDIDKITVQCAPFSIMTPGNVEDCNKLVESFGNDVRSFDITADKDRIIKMLADTALDHQVKSLDFRAKMIVHHLSGKVDQYCFCQFVYFQKNGRFNQLKDRKMLKYIDSLYWSVDKLNRTSQVQDSLHVYVCRDSLLTKYTYHLSDICKGFGPCRQGVTKIEKLEAARVGRLCAICSKSR